MSKNWQKLLTILSVSLWLSAGLYGLFFNITYIDEAKYIIKGWLIYSGAVSYYTTPGFLYQHMPLSLLWHGLSQILWGPSLFSGRLQAFLAGLLVLFASFRLSLKLGGKTAGIFTLILLGLAPTVVFYYSTATPQSLLILFLVMGFIYLYDGWVNRSQSKFLLASFWFSLTFLVRENFLFTLTIYLSFLLMFLRKNLSFFFKHLLVIGATLGIVMLPGYPGTINVLKNLPGVSWVLPVSPSEKEILSSFWQTDLQTPGLEWRAIRDFVVVFYAWMIIAGLLTLDWLIRHEKVKLTWNRKQLYWLLLISITGFNFIIHSWAAFKLSPRAIISYFPYVAPLMAVIIANRLSFRFKQIKNKKMVLWAYLILLILLPIGLRYGRNFAFPSRWPDLRRINRAGQALKPFVENKTKIIWIAEPISLFMAGKVSYSPLINHTGFYKPFTDTDTVRNLGFWNIDMLNSWFNEADLVVVEDNKINLLRESSQTAPLVDFINERLENDYRLVWKTNELWPRGLNFYEPKR